VRADVAGLTVFGGADLKLVVTLLAALAGQHPTLLGRLVLGDDNRVATGAGQGRLAVGTGLRGMAHGALPHGVGFGIGRYLFGGRHVRVDVHQTAVAIGTLLLSVFGMGHP
jgi:hypothetical protein